MMAGSSSPRRHSPVALHLAGRHACMVRVWVKFDIGMARHPGHSFKRGACNQQHNASAKAVHQRKSGKQFKQNREVHGGAPCSDCLMRQELAAQQGSEDQKSMGCLISSVHTGHVKMELAPLQGGAALALIVLNLQTLPPAACSPCWLDIVVYSVSAQAPTIAAYCLNKNGKVGAKQRGAPLLYLGERIRWLPLTTFRTHGVTGSSPASEASPELLMPLKVELCRAANGLLVAAVAGSRLLQAHSVPTSDKAGWPHCRLGAALQSLAPPLQARARPRSSMQAPMPGLPEGQQLATDVFNTAQLQGTL